MWRLYRLFCAAKKSLKFLFKGWFGRRSAKPLFHKDHVQRYSLILFIIVFCTGCYSINDFNFSAVKEINNKVDSSDGISSMEAEFIAQKFVYEHSIHHRLYSMTPYRVRLKKEPDAQGRFVYFANPKKDLITYVGKKRWEVQFRDREGSWFWGFYPVIPFYVDIDSDTGEVVAHGLMKENR